MAYQDDDSKTLDGSVLVHEIDRLDSVRTAPEIISITQSVPDKTAISPSNITPMANPKSKIQSTKHGRNLSLSNTIPSRYLTHAPSLIKLLESQRTPSTRNLDVPTMKSMNASKSAPVVDPTHDSDGGQSPSVPSIPSENDFNVPLHKESNGQLYDSEDNMLQGFPKQEEYEQLIHANSTAQNKDDIVDMHLLAAKAAEEFRTLANDNDRLQRDNDRMKEQHDDLLHEKELMMEQMTQLTLSQATSNKISDDIEILRSAASKWQLEKKLMMEQLREYKEKGTRQNGKGGAESPRSGMDGLVGKTGLKLKNRQSEDAERLMMESLAKITKEKSELEHMMFKEKERKREYEMMISNLKKELTDASEERERLNASLDKQQQLYYSLRENAKKKELEIDNIVGIARHETLQEEEEAEKEKLELLEAVDEQKAYIEELEMENQRLMATKVKDDDRMFNELKALRVHRFQPSMQFGPDAMPLFNAPSDAGTHSRAGSQSFSNYSQSGLFFATTQSNGELIAKTNRTQINLFNADDFGVLQDEHEQEERATEGGTAATTEEAEMDTPQPTQRKVEFKVVKPTAGDKADANKKKKMEEMRRINAEIEFFLLTCLAVKANLVEEYPDNPDVITEDPMKLFKDAQEEHVVMSKFNLWIELRLREKYALPKLEGFQKFMDKYDVKGKMSALGKEFDKVGVATKTFAKQTGKIIGQKSKEVGTRVRAWSVKKDKNDDTTTEEETDRDAAPDMIEEETLNGGTDNGNGEEQKEQKNWGEIIRRKTEEFGTRIRGLSKKNEEQSSGGTDIEKKGIAEEEEEEVNANANEGNNIHTEETNNKKNDNTAGNDGDNAANNKNKLCSCIVM